jgi:hypothetical protein
MQEKILQKLKSQRGQTSKVSDRSLETLAKSLVNVYTTEDLLATADFTEAIASLDGNISFHIADEVKKATDKAVADALAKAEKEKTDKEKGKGDKKEDEMPEWAKLQQAENKRLADELAKLQTEKIVGSRTDKLNEILKNTPAYLKTPILSSYAKAQFETDEDFNTYVSDIDKQCKEFEQAAKEQGLNTSIPGMDVQRPVGDGMTSELSAARNMLNKAKK